MFLSNFHPENFHAPKQLSADFGIIITTGFGEAERTVVTVKKPIIYVCY